MSNCLYLTHIQDLNVEAKKALEAAGWAYYHTPLVKERPRPLAAPVKTDFAIVTSFTAIKYALPWLYCFKRIYAIGVNTANQIQQYPGLRPLVYQGNSDCPSLEALFQQEAKFFTENEGAWFGSHAGALKHRDLLASYPSISVQITHWNWPNFEEAKSLGACVSTGMLICSSTSAAMAISSVLWADDVQLVVPSGRLKKHIDVTCVKKVHILPQWVPAITGKRL